MNEELVIKLEKRGDVTLFDLQGDVTTFAEPHINEAYKNAHDVGTSKILLKFYEDAYINSGGIAVLIQMLAETRKNDQNVAITGLSKHFQKIFNMVGITKFAKIYKSEKEALEGLSGSV
jgi:anti-anti-sigma factor